MITSTKYNNFKKTQYNFVLQNTINSLYKTISNSVRRLKDQEYIQVTANGETSNQNRTARSDILLARIFLSL